MHKVLVSDRLNRSGLVVFRYAYWPLDGQILKSIGARDCIYTENPKRPVPVYNISRRIDPSNVKNQLNIYDDIKCVCMRYLMRSLTFFSVKEFFIE